MKLVLSVGTTGAAIVLVVVVGGYEGGGRRTRSAVEDEQVEHISGTALGGSAGAERGLAVLEGAHGGGSDGRGGEGEDHGELHLEGCGWLVGDWKVEVLKLVVVE